MVTVGLVSLVEAMVGLLILALFTVSLLSSLACSSRNEGTHDLRGAPSGPARAS
jgi:hypothetical protein